MSRLLGIDRNEYIACESKRGTWFFFERDCQSEK